jgi:hypothetical protein
VHIITGLGRSGTSFIAEIFQNLGYDMGEYNPAVDAGFEHPEVTAINKAILNGDGWNPYQMKELSQKIFIAKDPRWIITLGLWTKSKCEIDSVIFCARDYDEILKSTGNTNAGMMARFQGWDYYYQIKIMRMLDSGFLDICKRHDILLSIIWFPDSLCNFEAMNPLVKIVGDEQKLYEAWKKTIRKPKI